MATNNYEAACGVKIGDIVAPGKQYKLPFSCDAIVFDPAVGMRFSSELGKPDGERTHQVGYIYQRICEQRVLEDTCPVLKISGTVFSTSNLT